LASCNAAAEGTSIIVRNSTQDQAINAVFICSPVNVTDDPEVQGYALYGVRYNIQPQSRSESFTVRLWPQTPEGFRCDDEGEQVVTDIEDETSPFFPQNECSPCARRTCVKVVAFVEYSPSQGAGGATAIPENQPT